MCLNIPKVFDVTLSLDTNIYADGDVLAATQEIANFFPANGITAFITGIQVLDEDDQGCAMDILLMNAATNIGTENGAYAITDEEARTIVGWIDVNAADYTDWGDWRTAIYKYPDAGYKIPGYLQATALVSSLYVGAITRGGTPTYTASGVRLKISVDYLG